MVQAATAARPAARGLGVPPVAEAGEAGHVAPDGPGRPSAPLIGSPRPGRRTAVARPGRPTARPLEPLLGRAHRELGLASSRRTPTRARRHARHGRPLDRLGAGRAGVGQEAERVEASRRPPSSGALEDPLQVGRDQEGRGRALAAQRRRAPSRRRSGSGWRASRPRAACPSQKRTETVWYIGEQTRCRSPAVEVPDRASSSKTARAVASSHSPVVTPLGRPVVPDV